MGQKIKPECFVDFLLFARDEYTTKHCQTVAVISQKLAADLKFSNNIIEHIVTAAYLHDIGKITWDDTLLKGSNQASSQEWLKIKNHPEIAGRFLYQMLSPVLKEHERLWIALVWVHHWKYVRDDDDYPPPSVIHGTIHPVLSACHLKFEDETWDLVRGVIQVADCFHAAVAERPYHHQKRTTQEALNDLFTKQEEKNRKLFHPKVLQCLGDNCRWLEEIIGR